MQDAFDRNGDIGNRLGHPDIRLVAKTHDTRVYFLMLEEHGQPITEPIELPYTICCRIDSL